MQKTNKTNNQLKLSKADQIIFFNALANPPKPNKELIKAAKLYKKQITNINKTK